MIGTVPAEIIYEAAKEYERLGYSCIPLIGNSKLPRFPKCEAMFSERIRQLTRLETVNLGIQLKGIVVADMDDETGYELAQDLGIDESEMMVNTFKGIHSWFATNVIRSTRIRFMGVGLDLKRTNYIVVPPSIVQGHCYTFVGGPVAKNALKVFPEEIYEREVIRIEPLPTPIFTDSAKVIGARNWIKKIVAVSGSGGHNATYRAACKLADAGLDVDQVLAELIGWNETNAIPKWDMMSLQHKAMDACKRKG